MKAIVLYESYFGNTEEIARAIGKASDKNIEVFHFTEITWEHISRADLLIVGSPTRGFRPGEHTKQFLKNIPSGGLKGIKIAAFDTRLSLNSISSKSLRFIVKTGGYAAKYIAKALIKKGGKLIHLPEGFFVTDEKGPLLKDETKRATIWAKKLLTSS